MNSRENKMNENLNVNSNTYTKAFVQAGFASSMITTATFPLYISQLHKMTNTGGRGIKMGPSAITNFLLTNYKTLTSAYTKNIQQSMTKSTIYSHREAVENGVSGLHENQSHDAHSSLETQQTLPLRYKLINSFITAGVLTPVDLLFTQYFAAVKTRYALCNKNLPKPYFPTFAAKAQFAKSGLSTRACSIGSNALFYVLSQSLVNDEFNKLLPREDYGYAGAILATATTGFLGGVTSNVFDVLFANIIENTKIQMTPQIPYDVLKESYKQGKGIPVKFEITSPGMFEMGKQLVKEEGVKAFGKGAKEAILMTAIVYGSYQVAEVLMNWFSSNRAKDNSPSVKRAAIATQGGIDQNLPQSAIKATQVQSSISDAAQKAKKQYGLFNENNNKQNRQLTPDKQQAIEELNQTCQKRTKP